MSKKTIFLLLWLFIISLGPITVLRNTSLSLLSDPTVLINFLQRIVGLLAFTLIFVQIILGSLMPKLIEKLGAWVFKFHTTEGALTYILILAHPLLFVFLNFELSGTFDPFYVFTSFCIICEQQTEYFYTLGRVAFWLITIAIIAAKFRTHPWLQRHWRKFHILNYVAFFFVWFHSFKVGTDIGTFPFSFFHGPALVIVSGILLYRLYSYFKPRFFNLPRPSPTNSTRRAV